MLRPVHISFRHGSGMTREYAEKFAKAALLLYSTEDSFLLEFNTIAERELARRSFLRLGCAVSSHLRQPSLTVWCDYVGDSTCGSDGPQADPNRIYPSLPSTFACEGQRGLPEPLSEGIACLPYLNEVIG